MRSKKFVVRIPEGHYMAGLHEFKTLRSARLFAMSRGSLNVRHVAQVLRREPSGALVPA